MIYVIIPTLNRPEKLNKLLNSLLKYDGICPVVIYDDEDLHTTRIALNYSSWPEYFVFYSCGGHLTPVKKWNLGVEISKKLFHDKDWFMLAADDLIFPENWVEKVLAIPNKGFIALTDTPPTQGFKWYEPHYMATAEWLDKYQKGMLCAPHYKHWCPDLEIAMRAHRSHTYTNSWDLVFSHPHPAFDTAPTDSTYERGSRYHSEDMMMFQIRMSQGFPDDF